MYIVDSMNVCARPDCYDGEQELPFLEAQPPRSELTGISRSKLRSISLGNFQAAGNATTQPKK